MGPPSSWRSSNPVRTCHQQWHGSPRLPDMDREMFTSIHHKWCLFIPRRWRRPEIVEIRLADWLLQSGTFGLECAIFWFWWTIKRHFEGRFKDGFVSLVVTGVLIRMGLYFSALLLRPEPPCIICLFLFGRSTKRHPACFCWYCFSYFYFPFPCSQRRTGEKRKTLKEDVDLSLRPAPPNSLSNGWSFCTPKPFL